MLLQQLATSILGEMMGVRGFIGPTLHPDFEAFSSGFRECFDSDPATVRSVSLLVDCHDILLTHP